MAKNQVQFQFGVCDADEDELYAAMDWLLERQGAIEQRLAKRQSLLGATTAELEKVRQMVTNGRLKERDRIGVRVWARSSTSTKCPSTSCSTSRPGASTST